MLETTIDVETAENVEASIVGLAMTPTELLAEIDAGRAPVILDVRSAWEFRHGHVPGAVHLPFWTIGTHASAIPGGRDQPIVVYCGHGPRAWRAGVVLKRHGFSNVIFLTGHMHGWRQAALREESGPE